LKKFNSVTGVFKPIILSVAVLSAPTHAFDISQQEINNGMAALMGTKPLQVGANDTKSTVSPTTREEVKLRLNEKQNSFARVSKNTMLKGESGAYFMYNSKLKAEMSLTVLSNIRKKYHSNVSFYQDESLGKVFKSSPISTEWDSYVNESNGFKKRKALKVLDAAFKQQESSMKAPHTRDYIFSYRVSGTYDFDFENMTKTLAFKSIYRNTGDDNYFGLSAVSHLNRKEGDRGSIGKSSIYQNKRYKKGVSYDTTMIDNINGVTPVYASLGGTLLDAININESNSQATFTVTFENEDDAERYENFVMDDDDVTYLQVQMKLSFNSDISSFVFTPVAGEIKSANSNVAISKLYTVDKVSTYLNNRKFVEKSLSQVLPLDTMRAMRADGYATGNIQLFNNGNELYYLIKHHSAISKIHNGTEQINTKGILAKYKYLGVLEGDYALWKFEQLSDNNNDKNSTVDISDVYDYVALKYENNAFGNKTIKIYTTKTKLSYSSNFLSEKYNTSLGDKYNGDLSSGDANMLSTKAKVKTEATAKSKGTTNTVATKQEKLSEPKVVAAKIISKPPIMNKVESPTQFAKNDKYSISCDLNMKDAGGFFDGQHIVGTQKTDVPREYLLNRIPQVLKSEGFIATTGKDSNALYYLVPQKSGKNYNHDVVFTDSGFFFEFRTYPGVSISTSAAKDYFCDVIAKI
jgi:hypothetical protein